MLKIVVSKPMAFAGVDFSKHKDLIDEALKDGHTPIVVSYLHGQLESKMGYDIGLCLNGEECINLEEEKYIPGIYDVEVVGYDKPCKAYTWNSNKPNCFIIDPEDKDALDYVLSKYNK